MWTWVGIYGGKNSWYKISFTCFCLSWRWTHSRLKLNEDNFKDWMKNVSHFICMMLKIPKLGFCTYSEDPSIYLRNNLEDILVYQVNVLCDVIFINYIRNSNALEIVWRVNFKIEWNPVHQNVDTYLNNDKKIIIFVLYYVKKTCTYAETIHVWNLQSSSHSKQVIFCTTKYQSEKNIKEKV